MYVRPSASAPIFSQAVGGLVRTPNVDISASPMGVRISVAKTQDQDGRPIFRETPSIFRACTCARALIRLVSQISRTRISACACEKDGSGALHDAIVS